jgi:hypothetical protein
MTIGDPPYKPEALTMKEPSMSDRLNLPELASSLPEAWRSKVVGKAAVAAGSHGTLIIIDRDD